MSLHGSAERGTWQRGTAWLMGIGLLLMGGGGEAALAGEKLLNIQGKLTDDKDNPLVDRHAVTFRLYDKATPTPVWESGYDIEFQNGLFNVPLGDDTVCREADKARCSLDRIAFDRPYALGMQVDGDAAEMAPRQLLGASAYALGSLGDFHAARNVYVQGKVGIGTSGTSPDALSVKPGATGYGIEVQGDSGDTVIRLAKGGNAGAINLYENKTQRISLDATFHSFINTGFNVGIGTASPGAKLEIRSSTLGATPLLKFVDRGGSAHWTFWYVDDDGSLRLTPSSPGYPFAITSGNVGIGTATPTDSLHVNPPASGRGITVSGAGGSAVATLSRVGDGAAAINLYHQGAQKISLTSDGWPSFLNSGPVGIGTTNPTEKLQVEGNVRVSGRVVNEENRPAFFVSVKVDDCPTLGWSHAYLGCPSGYAEAGMWHTGPGSCDSVMRGQGYENGQISSGWMALCVAQ